MEFAEALTRIDFMPIYTFQGLNTFQNLARGSLLQRILAGLSLEVSGQSLSSHKSLTQVELC